MLLGSILSQQLALYRAQVALARPGGQAADRKAAQSMIADATEEIRKTERALGIDKKAREAGGQHTVAQYLGDVKRAGLAKGIRISERVKAYEAFVMELRWRVRLLRNGDAEDRQYHPDTISDKTIVSWAEKELAVLEDADKKWAHEKGSVFVGRI